MFILGNSPRRSDRPLSQGQTPSRCSPPRNTRALTADIYGEPKPRKGDRSLCVSTRHLQSDELSSGAIVLATSEPPALANAVSATTSAATTSFPAVSAREDPVSVSASTQEPWRQTIREKTPRPSGIPPDEEEGRKGLSIKPFQLYQQEERASQPEPLRQQTISEKTPRPNDKSERRDAMVYEHRERRSRLVATSTRPTPLEITATPAPLALPTANATAVECSDTSPADAPTNQMPWREENPLGGSGRVPCQPGWATPSRSLPPTQCTNLAIQSTKRTSTSP